MDVGDTENPNGIDRISIGRNWRDCLPSLPVSPSLENASCELKSPPLLHSQETQTCLLSTPTSIHSSNHRPFTLSPAPPILRKPPIPNARNPIPQNPNSNPTRNPIRNMDPKPQAGFHPNRCRYSHPGPVRPGSRSRHLPLDGAAA